MTNQELIERVKKLDRLYVAMDQARRIAVDFPSTVNIMRMVFYVRQYEQCRDSYRPEAA